MKLVSKKPRRLFAFGCSFTEYHWATWPHIVAYDLDIPMYNLGRCGAGNLHIANAFAQALEKYSIDQHDLVMICWSGFLREDRWIGGHWELTGDITYSDFYDDYFMNKYVDPLGCYIRDFGAMSLVKRHLEGIGCQYHIMSMCDLWTAEMDYGKIDPDHGVVEKLKSVYRHVIEPLPPSFEVNLWNNKMADIKEHEQKTMFCCDYSDWHPTPREHCQFLQNVFDEHEFSQNTINAVESIQTDFVKYVQEVAPRFTGNFVLHKLPLDEFMLLFDRFGLVENSVKHGDVF